MGKHKFNFSKEPINIKESDNEPVLVSNKHFFEKKKKGFELFVVYGNFDDVTPLLIRLPKLN